METKNFLKILACTNISLGICSKILVHNHCMPDTKKRVIKSLDNLTEELRDLLRRQYPNGYEGNITRITNAKKEPIFVFPLETDDAIMFRVVCEIASTDRHLVMNDVSESLG